MIRLIKKGLAIGLTIAMAASTVACGKGNNTGNSGKAAAASGEKSTSEVVEEIVNDVQSGDHIYKEAASMIFDEPYVMDMTLTEDNNLCFIAGEDYDASDFDIIICDTALNELNRVTLKFDVSDKLGSVCVDKDGNIYAGVLENSNLYIIKYDSAGNEIANIDTQISSDDKACIDLTDNGIVVGSSNSIGLYDRELNYISGDSINSEYYIVGLVYKDGNVLYDALSVMDGITKNMGRFECASSTVTDSEIIEKNNLKCNVIGDADCYDTVYTATDSIYGYSYGMEPEKLINITASGIKDSFFKAVQIDSTHIVGYCYDFKNQQYKASAYEESEGTGEAREVITLGGNMINPDIKDKIVDFNNSNTDYYIAVTDYFSNATNDDIDAGKEIMKNDIIEGRCPDICIFNSQEEADMYEGKNAFVDLTEYMKKDGTYDNLIPSIKTICEKNGKLEGVPITCLLHGLVMKKSVYEATGSNVSLQNIKAIEDYIKKPVFGKSESKDAALRAFMYAAPSVFIDYQSKSCNYNSDSFIELLKYIDSTYPTEVSAESNLTMPNFKNNDAAFFSSSITNFRHFNSLEKESFGEEIVVAGFSLDGSSTGASLYCSSIVAISENAACKDGAYSLIKELLADDYQCGNKSMFTTFPVTLSALDILAEESTQELSDSDSDFAFDSGLEPITKERADYVKEILKNATDGCYEGSEEITEVIKEELAPFFAGDKSAEECADIVNQRVGIILNEHK